jgi:transposase
MSVHKINSMMQFDNSRCIEPSKAQQQDRSQQLAEVLRLYLTEGKGIRAISRKTGLARKTVKNMLNSAQGERRSISHRKHSSILDAYLEDIRKMLKECAELRAPAVLERLRAQGYQGGITIVRDCLRTLRPRPAQEAFFTCNYEPGQILQVDWADFGFALPGCARRVSAFVAALAYSRYLYIEFTLSQKMGCFLRCMDRALHFFGGRTSVDIFDNMKTVVRQRSERIVVFNPRFLEYARARCLAIQACTPRRPTEKPYVERPIGFIRTRFWPGRRFSDLFDLNAQATKWRDDTANNRIHEVTGKVPSLVFQNQEINKLTPVPDCFFDTDDIESCGVTKTFMVRFDRNNYSVPWRLVHQTVLVRANEQEVSVFLGQKRVAVHNRCWDVGKTIADPSHEQGLLDQKPRAAVGYLPAEIQNLGEIAEQYFKILAANGRSLRKEIRWLVLLCELYGDTPTRSAMDEVMATGHVGAEYIEYVLRHKKGLTPAATPLRLGNDDLDSIRLCEPDLSPYDIPRKTIDPGEPPELEKP